MKPKLSDSVDLRIDNYELLVLQNLCGMEIRRLKDWPTDRKEEIAAMQTLYKKLSDAFPHDITSQVLNEYHKERFPIRSIT